MPSATSSHAHCGTPSLQVSDARGLSVRAVQFHRREGRDPIETRVTEQRFDAVGRLMASRDAYLFELAKTDPLAPFNLTQATSLSGVALLTNSVDAGWRVLLTGGAEQAVERWDGRGSHSLTAFDELLRPVAISESGEDIAEHTLERFTYAGAEAIAHNLCGQLIRHDDPAGTVEVRELNMDGEVLSHMRRFLLRTDPPDWPKLAADRDALLEIGDGATTSYQFAVTGELLEQTDALRNRQAFAYTVAGQLKTTQLTLAGEGQNEKLLVSDIRYNVMGQIEAETAGNGVITRHRYDEANGRLTELSAHKAEGTPLQILKYGYDAGGNVLSIEDAAQPIRYFNNQRIEPIRTYRYDTLYQLIEASGCEAKTGQSGPALPDFHTLPTDPSQIANYTQTYHYDAGGNLLGLVHLGSQAHGRTLTRERYSNRCLPERDNRPPSEEELAKGFDANGNLRELQVGQSLAWDLRNQLSAVQLIMRKNAEADHECYAYDSGGQRVRKVNVSQGNARTLTREVRYLPGLEMRMNSASGEILHVITVGAGSNSVQVLHWMSKPPDEVTQNQARYSLGDQLKSSTLELDQNADLISQEWYYPFGGTAYWAGRNAIEAKYKTVRYSGKERDATGLYYYGFRYYATWLQRWINPDPAGYVDGINLYAMVNNNPAVYSDKNGLAGDEVNYEAFLIEFKENLRALKVGRSFADQGRAYRKIELLLSTKQLSKRGDRADFERRIKETLAMLDKPRRYASDREHYDHYQFITFLNHSEGYESFKAETYEEYKQKNNQYRKDLMQEKLVKHNELAQKTRKEFMDFQQTTMDFSQKLNSATERLKIQEPLENTANTSSAEAVPSWPGHELAKNIVRNEKNPWKFFPEPGTRESTKQYRTYALLLHPDKNILEGQTALASLRDQAMQILNDWRKTGKT